MNDEATPVFEAPHRVHDKTEVEKSGEGGPAPQKRTEKAISELGALTWTSSAERNRQLRLWRRAVFSIFREQPRAIRVAWVLTDLFNVKRGYAFPSNAYLAEETSMAVNKLRETLLILENGGAIIRADVINPATGQTQRVVYPATAIIPRPALGQGASPTLGQRGEPQQAGHQNLRRIPRIQSSQIALAKAESARRDKRKSHDACGPVSALQIAAPLATPQEGYPSSEATGGGKGTRLTEEVTAGMSRSDAAGKLMDVNDGGLQAAKLPWSTPPLTEDRQSSMLGTESAAVAATEAGRWRDRLATQIVDWFRGDRDWEAAKRLAWGDLENEWHYQHGKRWPTWQCAGCHAPIGGLQALNLPDGNRVHFEPIDCLIRFGKRWRGDASEALIAFGLEAPSLGEDQL